MTIPLQGDNDIMKLLLLLLCLLLCGCTPKAQTPDAPPSTTPPETVPVTMYAPDSSLEQAHSGALRVYPLTLRKVQGFRTMGEDLLVFSGYGATTITCLTGPELTILSSITLDFELDPEDPSLRVQNNSFSFFDPAQGEFLTLNRQLEVTRRIGITQPLTGSPILSNDGRFLYYCTDQAVLEWDQQTGVHRKIKEMCYESQELTGLHRNDSILQCRIRDQGDIQTLFFDIADGRTGYQGDGDIFFASQGQNYYAILPGDTREQLVFGRADAQAQLLYPRDLSAKTFCLPGSHAAVTAAIGDDDAILLTYYDLSSQYGPAELTLAPLQMPKDIGSCSGGYVYILSYDPERDCDTLYRWEVPKITADDRCGYTEDFSKSKTADPSSMEQLRQFASQIGTKYGLQIHIGEDALGVQPWDYSFEAETDIRLLQQELEALDQRLSQYPAIVLEKTASHFSSLNLCLLRSISGTAASGSLNTATGIQFFEGTDAYVAISVGKYSRQALYHELFHVMETHILTESSELDTWNELNPDDFSYTYSNHPSQEYQRYLSGESRAFIDLYSMSYPKEDKARILENAMLPGNRELFQAPILQEKLTLLCRGIRQAYGLKNSQDIFLWEQYLAEPLAP